jgi:hypothetical protein
MEKLDGITGLFEKIKSPLNPSIKASSKANETTR